MRINYKKSIVKVEETWGNQLTDQQEIKADISMNSQLLLSEPQETLVLNPGKYLVVSVPNFLINVEEDEEVIFKRIHKSMRREIRKAEEKDNFNYFVINAPSLKQIRKLLYFIIPFKD